MRSECILWAVMSCVVLGDQFQAESRTYWQHEVPLTPQLYKIFEMDRNT